jgi:hypothetical protein
VKVGAAWRSSGARTMIREVNALEEELKERQGEFIKRERVYRMRCVTEATSGGAKAAA